MTWRVVVKGMFVVKVVMMWFVEYDVVRLVVVGAIVGLFEVLRHI